MNCSTTYATDNENTDMIVGIREALAKTGKGYVKQNIPNILYIFENDPFFSGKFRFNELTERIDLVGDFDWKRSGTSVTDTDMNYINMYLDAHYDINSDKRILQALTIAANNNRYHPIRELLKTLVWDGTERVRYALHRFLGANTSDLTYESLKLCMLGAVSRVFDPGCKFEYMLCLVGGQGAGKSSFFRILAIRDEWFSDDIRKLDDDNVYRKLQGHWIIEMSEMIATSSAKSIEEIKSFISRQKETYKVPYETHPADRPRQCVFGGTSNKKLFLPGDRSGNRRFLPITCHPEEAEVHILDDEKASRAYILQMWAEIMDIYRKGDFKLCLPDEMTEQMREHQKEFIPEDSDATAILGFLDETIEEYVCSKMLYHEALGHPEYDSPQKWELNAINDIMITSVAGWEQGPQHRFDKYGQQRSWVRKGHEQDDGFFHIPEEALKDVPFR